MAHVEGQTLCFAGLRGSEITRAKIVLVALLLIAGVQLTLFARSDGGSPEARSTMSAQGSQVTMS